MGMGLGELTIIAFTVAVVGVHIWAIVDIATGDFDDSSKKVVWILIVLLISVIGPILYFTIGRQSRYKSGGGSGGVIMPKQR
jgi:Phospholipase_D-nuclease N-terminal